MYLKAFISFVSYEEFAAEICLKCSSISVFLTSCIYIYLSVNNVHIVLYSYRYVKIDQGKGVILYFLKRRFSVKLYMLYIQSFFYMHQILKKRCLVSFTNKQLILVCNTMFFIHIEQISVRS